MHDGNFLIHFILRHVVPCLFGFGTAPPPAGAPPASAASRRSSLATAGVLQVELSSAGVEKKCPELLDLTTCEAAQELAEEIWEMTPMGMEGLVPLDDVLRKASDLSFSFSSFSVATDLNLPPLVYHQPLPFHCFMVSRSLPHNPQVIGFYNGVSENCVSDIEALFRRFDADGGGSVDFNEFSNLLSHLTDGETTKSFSSEETLTLYQKLHQLGNGGDHLQDPEIFAVICFRGDHFSLDALERFDSLHGSQDGDGVDGVSINTTEEQKVP